MIEIIATAESVNQAKALVIAGVDTLYIGNGEFGLRLPTSFEEEDMIEIIHFAHEHNKKVCVAVNGLMHNDQIKNVVPYLNFLQKAGVDSITVGDPGVIHLMKINEIEIPYIYDAQTLVTSAKHINFWTKRGAQGAVLARELTFPELKEIAAQVSVPTEILVYGATCIHHSKRPLVENYYNFVEGEKPTNQDIFVSEPKKPDTHYSIYEDANGTHVFATDDINLMPHLDQLVDAGLTQWKLDGIFTKGDEFVEIASLFVEARQVIAKGTWTKWKEILNEQLISYHPIERTLTEGFFLKDPSEVQ